MSTDNIYINGITPQCYLPIYSNKYPYKEICETNKLCIESFKPGIENILKIFINTSIRKCKVLLTPMGRKLIIYGEIHIKIIYISNTSCQSVHSAHFNIPFCTFILLGNICRQPCDVCLYVEDAFVAKSNSRSFNISIVILAFPLFEKENDKLKSNLNCNENYYTNIGKN